MADILLSVGVQNGAADTTEFLSQLQSIANAVNKSDAANIKFKPVIDSSGLDLFMSHISEAVNSIHQIGSAVMDNVEKKATSAGNAVEQLGEKMSSAGSKSKKLDLQIDLGKFDAQFEKIAQRSMQIKSSTNELSEALGVMGDALRVMNDPTSSGKAKAEAFTEFTAAMSAATAQLQLLEAAERKEAAAAKDAAKAKADEEKAEEKTLSNKTKMYNLLKQVEELQKKIAGGAGPGAKSYGDLDQLRNQLVEMVDVFNRTGQIDGSKLKEVSAAFAQIRQEASSAGDTVRGFGSGMSQLESRFVYMFSLTNMVMQAIRQFKNMVKTTVELDSAMTQLRVVTTGSESDYTNYGNTVANTAKEIGASITDLVDSATVFARLGYSLDESGFLAKYTAMLSNVGNVDISVAQDALTAITKAFDIDPTQIESVMDKMVKVGNSFPISVSQIAEGMNNAGSALAAAGNSFEESVALLTAANTTIQNISKASTGLRTITARIRNTKTELDDLGETVETAAYEEMISTLTKRNVLLTTANGEYRSTYDILQDIAKVWDQLTSMEQAAVASQLAGNRQQNVFYSIVNQFKEAQDAMSAMENSTGSLASAYAEYYSSIQAHVNSFKAAFQELSQTVVNSDLAKGVVDIGTKVLSFFNGIAKAFNKIGGIAPIITGLFTTIAAGALPKIIASLGGLPNYIAAITNAVSVLKTVSALRGTMSFGIGEILGGIFASPAAFGIAAAGITAIVSGIISIKKAYDEAHPSVSALKQDLSDIQAELDSLDSAKKKNDERILELRTLSSSGGITHYEEAELEYLSSQNALIQEQIELQERLKDLKNEAIASAAPVEANNWLGQGAGGFWYDLTHNSIFTPKDKRSGVGALTDALADYWSAETDLSTASNEKAAAKARADMADAATRITALTNQAIALKNELSDINSEEAIQLQYWIDTANRALGIFNKSDFSAEFKKLPEGIIREFGEEADLTAEQVEQLAGRYGLLKRWMEENGYTAEDVAIQFNRMRAETADTSAGVEDLTDDVTNLSQELQQATKDLEAYANATSGEKGDVANKYGDAYKKFIEDWNAGKTGTNAVRAAVELFIPPETLRDLDYDVSAAGEILASDLYQALFSGEGDIGENFANYIRENIDSIKGLSDVVTIIDGENSFDFAYDSLSGLADVLGLSENAVAALLDSLDKYGVQAMMSAEGTKQLATDLKLIGPEADTSASNIERVYSAINGLAKEGKSATEIKTLLDALDKADYINLDEIKGLGPAIADAVEKAKELGDEDNKPSIDVDISGVESGTKTAQELIDGVHGNTVQIGVETVTSGGVVTSVGADGHSWRSRAAGGPVHHGGKTLVNELGPEIISEDGEAYIAGGGKPTVVDLKPGAIVLDAETSKRAMRGGAFKGIPIKAHAYGSPRTAAVLMTDGGKNLAKKLNDVANSIKDVVAATIPTKNGSGNNSSSGGGGSGGSGGSSNKKEETWFEKQLAEHKHLVEMDKESLKDYLDWLDSAYKKAYKEGIIDLKEYRSREEEVYKGRQNDFKDHLNDTEHLIDLEKNGDNNPTVIYNLYAQMIADIEKELEKCYQDGLGATNEYVQYLQNTWIKYSDAVKKQQDEANKEAKKQVKDLVDYRIKMLKQYLKNEIQNLKDRLSFLKEFYSKQKELLQDVRDEEKYLDDQAEKRKAVTDIQAELKQLEKDTSAWAQKRKLKLQEELEDAQKTLDDFEKDHALKVAQDQLDAIYEAQEKDLNAQIDALQDKLDNPQYLYEQALSDVQNNSIALYEEMIEYNNKYGTGIRQDIVDMWEEAYISLKRYHDLYNEYYKGINLVNATGYVPDENYNKIIVSKKGYASGTSFAAPGLHRVDELGAEAVFTSNDGSRYRMLSAGDKVLSADATSFLYNFAENGRHILSQLFNGSNYSRLGLVGAAGGICEIRTGDIIIQGNADDRTVSEIRRAQRDGVSTILKELKRLKK